MLQKIGLKFRLSLLFVILLYAGCTEVDPINTKRDIKHTIIVYMAADNNLTGYVADNIDKMRLAMNNELSKENTIVAYVDQLNKKPCLLEIYNQKIDTIRVYDEMNSTDSEVLESIIGEVIDKCSCALNH